MGERSGELLYRIYLTETAEGHARAHGPGIDTTRMSMNSDLGFFAHSSNKSQMFFL